MPKIKVLRNRQTGVVLPITPELVETGIHDVVEMDFKTAGEKPAKKPKPRKPKAVEPTVESTAEPIVPDAVPQTTAEPVVEADVDAAMDNVGEAQVEVAESSPVSDAAGNPTPQTGADFVANFS